jgi:hypothetical protein
MGRREGWEKKSERVGHYAMIASIFQEEGRGGLGLG